MAASSGAFGFGHRRTSASGHVDGETLGPTTVLVGAANPGGRRGHTERLFNRAAVRAFGVDIQRVALRKLRQLDAAMTLDDLRVPPSNRLEKLRGAREGHYSIRINDQWRIGFEWREGDAYDVEIVDYH